MVPEQLETSRKVRPENRSFELVDTETIVILVRNNTRMPMHSSLIGKKNNIFLKKKYMVCKHLFFLNLLLRKKKKNLYTTLSLQVSASETGIPKRVARGTGQLLF